MLDKEKAYTERFLSSLMGLISILRRPIIAKQRRINLRMNEEQNGSAKRHEHWKS